MSTEVTTVKDNEVNPLEGITVGQLVAERPGRLARICAEHEHRLSSLCQRFRSLGVPSLAHTCPLPVDQRTGRTCTLTHLNTGLAVTVRCLALQ